VSLSQLFSRRGFTLIELLVVITIIIILAAVVMIAINPAEMARRGRDATRLSDLESVRKGIDLGVAEFTITTIPAGPTDSCGQSRISDDAGNWIGGMDVSAYLSVLPIDPDHNKTPCVAYYYAGDTVEGTYELNATLESTTNDGKEDYDGGNDGDRYEVGTDPGLNLISPAP